ncbi:MAG TPA: hypothetical protein VHX63_10855 [Acidobacteriaceae bacterium]|nr:hypothetical protein [Acidobacteriaceae bacterium]
MSADLSVRNPTAAQQRMADALLRSLGGRIVLLRLPTNAQTGVDNEQLGLATPSYEDIPLSPAVFRRVRAGLSEGKVNRYELLISASSIQTQLGLLQLASADEIFAMAIGVFVDGELMLIESAAEAEMFGQPYLYRLLLEGPQSQIL